MGFFIKETQSKRAKKSNLGVSKETLIKMGCRACPLRQEPEVLPSGANGDAVVYVLGDGPSPADVKKQRVFSGKVGKVVRHAIPFDYEDLVRYGTTVFKAVPDDKAPSDIAMQCCRPKVEDDIYQSGAKVVLGLGPTALKWASGETSMHNWRGRRFPIRIKDKDMWFFVTHHAKDTLPLRWGDQQKPSDDEKQADRDTSHLFANYAVWPTPKVHTRDDWWQGVTCIDGRRGEADLKKLERTLEELSVDPVLGFDLETSGLRPYKEGFKILTASVSNGEDTVAFPLDHKDGWDASLRKRAHKIFLKWLKNNSAKIAHNLSFEMEVLCVYYNDLQLSRSVKWHDTLAQAYVLDGRKGMNDLDTLVFLKFGFWIKDIFSGLDKSNLENADLETLLKYNALDAKYTKMLFSHQQLDVQDAGMEQVYWDQMRRIPTCVLTQIKGLPVDQGIVGKWEKKLQKEIDKSNRMLRAIPVVQRFEKEYGSFNPASNEHIGIILEKYIKSSEAKTKTGKVSTSKNVLENLDHPFGKYIIQMREAQKLKSTYNDSIRFPDGEYIWPDGKIHQNLNHALTETRRTSSSSPNCQNFPKRKFANIREQIVAPPGHWFLSVDYGQIEYRVIGMMSKDKVVVQALWEDYDVHMEWFEKLAYAYPTWVGGKKMIKDPDTRKKFRNKAKNEWVFPLFFGASFNGVCKYLGIPENFVRPVYDEFWDTFSGVKKWQNKLTNRYENEGYVETLTGFRRWAPISRNQLINAPVQGTASEIVIDGMNRLSERAIKEDWNLQPVLNIHDDLSFILPDEQLDDLFTSVIDEMLGCKFSFLNVPLLAEATIGRDWYKHDEVGNFRSDKWFS